MQQVSNSIVDIMQHEGHHCIPYIDDLAGVNKDPLKVTAAFRHCSELLAELGVKEAVKKQSPPAKVMTWLGVQFDCENMQMSIPQED